MGFAAILPGKRVAVGATWKWQGDLLNTSGGQNITGTFRLAEVVEHDGELIARITGTVNKGWQNQAPDVRVELRYSIDRGVPVSSKYRYRSERRTTTVRTTARWLITSARVR